jgi:OTU domain-containing protein 6
MSSRDDIDTAHKKALKAWEGEKRAAIKKAKGIKGKKGKETLAAVEEEYATKLKELESMYEESLAALGSLKISSSEAAAADGGNATGASAAAEADTPTEATGAAPKSDAAAETEQDDQAADRERKLAKARKKRERQKEKEAKLQEQIEQETANAGPSMRQIELRQIQAILTPLNLTVSEVEADGHCLYRAVAAQANKHYTEIRKWKVWRTYADAFGTKWLLGL